MKTIQPTGVRHGLSEGAGMMGSVYLPRQPGWERGGQPALPTPDVEES
ncbi:MAG TPA: hypothetical protein VFF81_12135 [Noviherbaspirillum sp.]|nr:hypothetical protein [Noviherbaspirillum sp.]